MYRISAIAAVLAVSSLASADPPKPKTCHKYSETGITVVPCPKKDKAPPTRPAPPDDSNTCVPSPPTCTGQWCTSCDEAHCMDFDGPGISISLCDGEWSWCTEGDCGAGEFPGCTIDHKPDEAGGSGRCDIHCDNGFSAGCSYGRNRWRCDTPEAYGLGPSYGGPIEHGNPCTW